MRLCASLAAAACALILSGPAPAYDLATHQRLSGIAADQSVLQLDPTVLEDLGLRGLADLSQRFLSSENQEGTIRDLIVDGSRIEDRVALNPFANPEVESAPRLMFRGVDLQNVRFAADASPLGEVFFATENKSAVIHEPRSGGMPRIELPPDAFAILSAIWL